jgi:glycerophosphoryl diester phosphodiesterase
MQMRFRRRVFYVIFSLIILGLLVGHLIAKPVPPHPFFTKLANTKKPLVIAHQGGEAIRPSNTMMAFNHAMALGVHMLDTDVHLSKDGVLVLIHDETIDRTTDGTGAVRDLTLAQLKALDAGYRFTPDNGVTFPFRGLGVRIPTLEELFMAYTTIPIGIEIKQAPPEIAVPLCALIRKYSRQDTVIMSSFRPDNMLAFRRECPEVATSPTENEVRPFFFLSVMYLEGMFSPNWHALQVPEFGGGFQVLTPRFVTSARKRGIAVYPWTINDTDQMRRMIALGVDGINTDYPDRLLELVR